MTGARYYIRRLVRTDLSAFVTDGHIEGAWWGVFADQTNVTSRVFPTAAECHAWIVSMGGFLINAPAAPSPTPAPEPAPKPVQRQEHVSCDRCSARAIVTLVTHGGGLLSFCGHHNRGVQERYDVFASARAATNDLSDAALRDIVDGFLDSTLGHHLEVAA